MTVKSLLVKISADVAGFNRDIEGSKKKWADVCAGMTKVGMGLTAAVTLPLLAVGAAAIKLGMNAIESENLFEISMGGMADAARAWSVELRKQLGLNEYEVRKNVGVLFQMTSSMGLTEEAAYDVATGMTQLSYDMASFFNLKPEEAFAKLQSGISGEIKPLKDLGILVDETTVKHYAWKEGIAAQGEELTQGQKVLARYGVIMEATKNAQGDMARTMDSPTNKLRVMKEQTKMAATELGMSLMPAFQALLGVASKVVTGLSNLVQWFTALPSPVKTVIIVLAGLAAAAGPALIVLAKMLPLIKSISLALPMLKSGFMLLLNPIALLVAAAAALAFVFYQVAQAQEAAYQAAQRYEQANERLLDKLRRSAEAAGMSAVEFGLLVEKYKQQGHAEDALAAKMAMAIHKKKEGLELAKGLAKVSAEQKAAIDAEKAALEGAKRAQEEKVLADEKAKASLEAMKQLRAELTDAIAKATMTEAEYTRYSLDQELRARVENIQKSAAAEREKNALILMAKQTHDAQVRALDNAAAKEQITRALENRQKWLEGQAEAQKQYLAMKQGLQDQINQMTMGELEYALWALEQERLAKIQALAEDKLLTETQKAEIMALLEDYYETKRSLAEEDAKRMTELEMATMQTLSGLYQDFWASTLDGFQKWGEGQGNLLKTLGESYKDMTKTAMSAIKSLVSSAAAAAVKDVISAKASAIANVIKSVMASVPFPLNLALAGGAIAAVSALFSRIKLGEGGVVMGPTFALVGERGPEVFAPLDDFRQMVGAGQGREMVFQQTLHFHGNISSALSLEEISRELGQRTVEAIQRGGRY